MPCGIREATTFSSVRGNETNVDKRTGHDDDVDGSETKAPRCDAGQVQGKRVTVREQVTGEAMER